jgi:hypothetical protein
VIDFINWWAREDSNLQPSGYEPLALTIELRARPALTPANVVGIAYHIKGAIAKAVRRRSIHDVWVILFAFLRQ